jgi:GUN4-like/NACHT domain
MGTIPKYCPSVPVMAEKSDASEKKPAENSLSDKLADIAVKVLMGGGIAAGGSGALWSLLVQNDIPKAIASGAIGLGIALGAALLQPIYEGSKRRFKKTGEQADRAIDRMSEAAIATINNVEERYFACQAAACETCDTEGMVKLGGIFTPMLEQVFVSLELDPSDLPPGFGTPLSDEEGLERFELASFRNIDIWKLLARASRDPVYSQIAILAWGGSGKTTLLKHLAYTLGKNEQPDNVQRFIPVLLLLRKYRDVLTQDNPPNLLDLITQKHIASLPAADGLQMPQNWARGKLRAGKMLILLDGFDEVPKEKRPLVARWLQQQMSAYKKSVFILTARPKAYLEQTGETLNLHTKLFVRKLTPPKRREFIQKWYWCQEYYAHGKEDIPKVKHLAKEAAENLLAQIEGREALADLTENPLLLNMVAMFHRYDPSAKLPKRRVELYQQICKLLLNDRPGARNIALLMEDWEAAQTTLQMLALDMMRYKEERIERQALLGRLKLYLQAQDETVAETDFLNQIEHVSELLIQREQGEYEFPHLSFQEFLAAKEVVRLRQEAWLYDHFDNDKWKPTILLYAAQTKKPSSLIRAALEKGATALAYSCWQETSKRIDDDLKGELQELKALKAAAAQTKSSRYQKLEEHLQQGEWQSADEETYRLMITTVGKEEGQWFSTEDLLKFPCEELKAIDGLWVTHSKGHFGFSVQKESYLSVGGIADGRYYEGAWNKFCHEIGWQKGGKYMPIHYDLNSQKGHLPFGVVCGVWGGVGVRVGWGLSLLSNPDL